MRIAMIYSGFYCVDDPVNGGIKPIGTHFDSDEERVAFALRLLQDCEDPREYEDDENLIGAAIANLEEIGEMRKFSEQDVIFCAEECEKQRTEPMAVLHMLRALRVARQQNILVPHFILDLGLLVDPKVNLNGWRTVPVTLTNSAHPSEIQDKMHRLMMLHLESEMTALEFYEEFQTIHPFRDGNGRVGAILFNFLNKTLDCPVAAPDLFAEKI